MGQFQRPVSPCRSEIAWHRMMGQRRSRHVPACLSGMGDRILVGLMYTVVPHWGLPFKTPESFQSTAGAGGPG